MIIEVPGNKIAAGTKGSSQATVTIIVMRTTNLSKYILPRGKKQNNK
jgi:hypothetical protein